MLGNVVNALSIIIGGIIGIVFKGRIPKSINDTMVQAIGFGTFVYGISIGVTMSNPLIVFICLSLGAIVGEALNIEGGLNSIGSYFQERIKKSKNVAQGFVSSSLVFCVGAMAIMGALQSGLEGKHEILFAKAFLDGTMSIIFASTMGVGVLLSSGSTFIYQGVIVLLSGYLKPLLTDSVIHEMTAIGGILISGIGINLLLNTKLKVGNLIPALFIPIVIYLVYPF